MIDDAYVVPRPIDDDAADTLAVDFNRDNLSVGDLDGDGDIDIYNLVRVGTARNEFIQNNGNGTFTKVTGASNPLNGLPATTSNFNFATFSGDFDSDGDTDIVARAPGADDTTTSDDLALVYWNNNGDGTWTQLTGSNNPFSSVSLPGGGAAFTRDDLQLLDADGDGDIDIYNRASDQLYQNQGGPSVPTLTGTTPADNATGIARGSNLQLTFSEAVNLGTGAAGGTNAPGAGDVAIYNANTNVLIERLNVVANAARFTGVGTTTITIDPVSDLPKGAPVYVLVGTQAFVSTAAGTAFAGIGNATTFNFTIVANVNPAIGNLNADSATFTEDGAAVLLDVNTAASVTDTDNANFNAGSLTVSITANEVAAEDELRIDTSGTVTLSAGFANGSVVSVGGVSVGTITADGNGGDDLVIAFNTGATPARVQTLVQSLTYFNSNTSNPSTAARTVSVALTDGDGGNAAVTTTVNIAAVNDAPVLADTNVALAAQSEDSGPPPPSFAVGTLVSSLIDLNPPAGGNDNATDADGAVLTGIALTGIDETNGTWYYSVNGGAAWVAVSAGGAVSDSSALLLAADLDTYLYFQPDADFNGIVPNAITFRAWDQSNGVEGNRADASANGGATAFSAAIDTASLRINGVSDTITVPNDYNGDSTSDLLWQNDDGTVVTWDLNGGTVQATRIVGVVPPDWTAFGRGDFNKDGQADVVWRSDAGSVAIWEMDGGQIAALHDLGQVPTTWHIAETGDFNGDGTDDLLWRNDNGDVVSWELGASQLVATHSLGSVALDWQIQGAGDFNGDGNSDVLWRNSAGNVVIWDMAGDQVLDRRDLGAVAADWSVAEVGDFNNDDTSDILWYRTDGSVLAWTMNNGQVGSLTDFGSAPATWQIADSGDYDADGSANILWRHTSGSLATWELDSPPPQPTTDLGALSNDWQIIA